MPELPEVETIRLSLVPYLAGRRIRAARIHNPALRWPISPELEALLQEKPITKLIRRGKYLLFDCKIGNLILHLGMSGSLRLLPMDFPLHKHEHFELILDNSQSLRLRDPRRFGAVLWHDGHEPHPLLAHLGPEPLGADFNGKWLYLRSRGRSLAIKQFLMDSHTVAGLGNIYVSEALFHAKISPLVAAGRVSLKRYSMLTEAIQATLRKALEAGGSSLRDFVDSAGNPGYFQFQYQVYGRANQPCRNCGHMLRLVKQAQRATVYCNRCQR